MSCKIILKCPVSNLPKRIQGVKVEDKKYIFLRYLKKLNVARTKFNTLNTCLDAQNIRYFIDYELFLTVRVF